MARRRGIAGRDASGAFVAAPAFQNAAQAALPALLGSNPGPNLPGRVMAHMLGVPALELRDPVLLLVLVVPHDLTLHDRVLLHKIRHNG